MVARRRLTLSDSLWFIVLPALLIAALLVIEDHPEGLRTSLVVLGAVGLLWLARWWDSRPLIIDERGIRNGRNSFDLPWDRIDGVYFRVQEVPIRNYGMRRYGWVAIDSPLPGRRVLGLLRKLNAAMVRVPENAGRHMIMWDGGIEPDLRVIAAVIEAYGVPVDGLD